MIKRNKALSNLTAGYLFPEIARRRREFAAAHPEARIISLGIGNTTEPLTPHIDAGLVEGARRLGTLEGYSGYGDEQGLTDLRERIAAVFYGGKMAADEVFVSDGAKCDIGRLQLLFGGNVEVAVQDPSYPVYVDGSVLIGAGGAWQGVRHTCAIDHRARATGSGRSASRSGQVVGWIAGGKRRDRLPIADRRLSNDGPSASGPRPLVNP